MPSSLPVTLRPQSRAQLICRMCKIQTHFIRPAHQNTLRRNQTNSTVTTPQDDSPIEDYYSLLLSQPLQHATPATRTVPIPQTPESPNPKEAALQKARVVFGSRLAGPAERRRTNEAKATLISGVLVPPRPQEPDNCCMSGCVNCVWDAYRDDMEEWASKRAEAMRRSITAQGNESGGSMDDDGGGSEGNWTTPEGLGLFEGVPVGIREFMRTEKRLKERHQNEGTSGG